MAGKTLPGIGDDESGEHDAGDASDSGLRDFRKPATAARSTDRMPLAMPVAVEPQPEPPASGKSIGQKTLIGAPLIDEDKVAEGLKKLRSLDEPLGSLAVPVAAPPSPSGSLSTTTPTLKEGMPAVGAGTPTPVTPAVAAAELLRSRGTAHGHALSTAAAAQALMPLNIDDRIKGTLLGHSLHLPDLPNVPEESSRPAEVRSVTDLAHAQQVPPAGQLRPSEMQADFSHGDARFFDSEPVNHELEPEKPRANLMFRGVVFFAVICVFAVAAFAWVNARKSDSEAHATTPEGTVPPPSSGEPAAAPAPTAAAAPTAPAPEVIAPTAATPPAPAPAAVAPAAAVVAAPAPVDEVPAESPTAKLKRELAATEAAKTPRPTPHPVPLHTTHRSDSPRVAPTAAAKTTAPAPSAKHAKVTDDPDGTLPLTE